jgi:hypothetical protein
MRLWNTTSVVVADRRPASACKDGLWREPIRPALRAAFLSTPEKPALQ